eukprot:comp20243_c0_seq1/m.25301 comp20243_c0_seq1/g.25301  ORF comp20243_c0_seq1/g.25301 comp20243_c0_seq1/m.25301 type:complete len:226 (-) comp20243_c0_seq1:367-1044(-)
MAFSDQEVNKQIQHMVSFIEQEAAEKANEILVKAEEEFNIEKGRIVQQEKLKVMSLYEKKEKQVDIQRKIVYSNELNKHRLQVLQAKNNHVQALLEEARDRLVNVTKDAAKYRKFLSGLILEGCYVMLDSEILVVARKSDADVVKGLIPEVQGKYKEATGKDVKITLAQETLAENSSGGVIVTSVDGRIRCEQTLEKRLDTIAQTMLPQIRIMLFGRSASRKHLD